MRKMTMVAAFILLAAGVVQAADMVIFDFEDDVQGWGVPEWCYEKTKDYVCKTTQVSADFASSGKSSLMLEIELPGQIWHAAIVECDDCEFDWTKYGTIACDFYLPKKSPSGIEAKLILTIDDGGEWKWTETVSTVSLVPGEWVTLKANLKPGSKDWMRLWSKDSPLANPNDPKVTGGYMVNVTDEFRASVKKIAVRIETDKPRYKGPVYIDNIRVAE